MFVSNKQPVYFIEPSMIQRFRVWTVIIYCEIVNMDLKSQNNSIDSIKFCRKGNVISTVSNIKILAIISHLMPCWTHFSFQLRHFKRLKLMITHICIFVRAVYYFFEFSRNTVVVPAPPGLAILCKLKWPVSLAESFTRLCWPLVHKYSASWPFLHWATKLGTVILCSYFAPYLAYGIRAFPVLKWEDLFPT